MRYYYGDQPHPVLDAEALRIRGSPPVGTRNPTTQHQQRCLDGWDIVPLLLV